MALTHAPFFEGGPCLQWSQVVENSTCCKNRVAQKSAIGKKHSQYVAPFKEPQCIEAAGPLACQTPLTNLPPSSAWLEFLAICVAFFKRETLWWPLLRYLGALVEWCVHYKGGPSKVENKWCGEI